MRLPSELFEKIKELLSDVRGNFNLGKKELIMMGSAAGILILSGFIIGAIASGEKDAAVKKSEISDYNFGTADNEDSISRGRKAYLSDFMLYDDEMEEQFTGVVMFREPQKKWSEEMVDRFWVDTDEIGEDLLEIEARKLIKDIFADVE